MTYVTKQGDMFDGVSYALYRNEKFMEQILDRNVQHADIFIFFSGVELDAPDTVEEMGPELPPWRTE